MSELQKLYDRIIRRVTINLRELQFDVDPLVHSLISPTQMGKFYAFYGITPHHPLNLVFRRSNLAGSYFLGKCRVTNSLLYKSDIRGDELKKQGDKLPFDQSTIPVDKDEEIRINDSLLIKTLIHNHSHNPEAPERFSIRDTVSTHYANIHGSPTKGCYLGPFATADLTTLRDSVIDAYTYVQAGEICHVQLEPGTVWIRKTGAFNFYYRHPGSRLEKYIRFTPGQPPQGILIDFVEAHKKAFEEVFNVVNITPPPSIPASASLDRFAVIRPSTRIGENVLVAQRALIQNSSLGKGANAQENCYLINATLEGNNVTAHGAKIVEADLGSGVFVGFNSFVRGTAEARVNIGQGTIILPHTIIDCKAPLTIPSDHLVWGLINNEEDLQKNSIALKTLSAVDTRTCQGGMLFEGDGKRFVASFQDRIHHILEANGAFYDGEQYRGHAQQNQNISFNIIQPYPMGERKGLYPTIIIRP